MVDAIVLWFSCGFQDKAKNNNVFTSFLKRVLKENLGRYILRIRYTIFGRWKQFCDWLWGKSCLKTWIWSTPFGIKGVTANLLLSSSTPTFFHKTEVRPRKTSKCEKFKGNDFFEPRCDSNGDFEPRQCLKEVINGTTTGTAGGPPKGVHCWCVTSDGQLIPGTVHAKGRYQPNCLHYTCKFVLVLVLVLVLVCACICVCAVQTSDGISNCIALCFRCYFVQGLPENSIFPKFILLRDGPTDERTNQLLEIRERHYKTKPNQK